MTFNTAIFYDIENLLKGYSFSQEMISNLSLEEIVTTIQKTDRLGQIAVQRAYANWSDPRLAIMRGEINELGIDPIQVFGFSRDQKKNAADIQLAIDAIDLAYVRPAIEVFVIVSGDGGFASLAKKLHEYGKTVIGCAYRFATNKIFQAVCDDFVWIEDHDEEETPERVKRPSTGTVSVDVQDPRNIRLAAKIKKASSLEPKIALAKAKEVLNWYLSDSECRTDLGRTGMVLSVVQEAMKFTIPGFQSLRFGFPKFIEFMQYLCSETQLCITRPSSSLVFLMLRNAVPTSMDILPDLEPQDYHTVDGYYFVLSTGTPSFRIPPVNELKMTLAWLVEHPPEKLDIGTMIEDTVAGLNGQVSTESTRFALLSLASANVFDREPPGVTISDQKLTLKPDLRNLSQLSGVLRATVKDKILGSLGRVDEHVLEQILPSPGG